MARRRSVSTTKTTRRRSTGTSVVVTNVKASDAATTEATEKAKRAAERSLNPVAKEINTKLERAAQNDKKAEDFRISAALRMAEAKAKCQDVGLPFKKWVEDHITVEGMGYENARKLAAAGSSGSEDETRLAIEDMRAKNARANKAARERTKAAKATKGTRSTPTSAPDTSTARTPFKQAADALDKLDDNVAVNLIQSRAAASGLKVVSEAEVAKHQQQLADAAKAVKEARAEVKKAAGGKSGMAAVKAAFSELPAAHQLQFVRWAAEEIGATLDQLPDDGEIPEIPSSLDRRPAAKRRRGNSSRKVSRGVTA